MNDPEQPFDAVLDFFKDEDRQRRMEESEIHHERARLVELVWELETQPIESFLSSREALRTNQFREVVGVVVRMVVERLGRERTGKKGSFGVLATLLLRTATCLPEKPLAWRFRLYLLSEGKRK